MKKFCNFILIFILILSPCILLGCSNENEEEPEDNRPEITYFISIRNTFFENIDGVNFYLEEERIESSYMDYKYKIISKESISEIIPEKLGYIFHHAETRGNLESNMEVLFVCTLASRDFTFGEPFSFSGKVVEDFDGETRIQDVKIIISNNFNDTEVLFTSDSFSYFAGNFGFHYLYEELTFTFEKEGYFFAPPSITVNETIGGFTSRGIK